jgi:hypothetical protein
MRLWLLDNAVEDHAQRGIHVPEIGEPAMLFAMLFGEWSRYRIVRGRRNNRVSFVANDMGVLRGKRRCEHQTDDHCRAHSHAAQSDAGQRRNWDDGQAASKTKTAPRSPGRRFFLFDALLSR